MNFLEKYSLILILLSYLVMIFRSDQLKRKIICNNTSNPQSNVRRIRKLSVQKRFRRMR